MPVTIAERMRALLDSLREFATALGEMARKVGEALKRLLPVVRKLVLEMVRTDAEQAARADWDGVLWPKGELGVVGHVR